MENILFTQADRINNPHRRVMQVFNSFYQQDRFLYALSLLSKKTGFCCNEDYCSFGDMDSPDYSSHFSGVLFGCIALDEEVNVTDEQCDSYLREACERYLQHHPDDEMEVKRIFEENGSKFVRKNEA